MYQWNTRRKKNISPKGKQLLVQTVLENEAFNSIRDSERLKEKRKKTATTRRERKSKCYICKEKGHAYWSCECRKKIAGIELQQEENITDQIIDQE